jgi:hypothetical protein
MTSKNPALLLLEQSYEDFTKHIRALPDRQFLTAMDGWSARDVVAHLIGWNGLMIESSRSILAGRPPTYYQDKASDYSHINAGFVAEHASSSKPELLAELETSMEKFEAFIDQLPPEELEADHGVVHYSGSPATVRRIIRSLASDYQAHTRQIQDWFAVRKGPG